MLSMRHSVPMVFVLTVALSALAGLIDARAWWVTAAAVGSYLAVNLAAALRISVQRRDPAYLLLMPFAFGALHVLYGVGATVGLARAICSRRFWLHFFRETKVAERIA
jgi:hypothetical protein